MPSASSSYPVNAVLFGLWGLFWIAMTAVQYQDAIDNPYTLWWQPGLWELSSAVVATVWLLAQRAADARYQQYLERPPLWFLHHLKWFPLIGATQIPGMYAIRHAVYGSLGLTYEHPSWSFVFIYETVKLLLFGGMWLCIIFGLDSFSQWRTQNERLLALQRSLAESQLLQLQSQLRPHFLFNALNTISSLMHADPARADRLLVRLSDLLRASLSADRKELMPLKDELHLLDLYAQIMQERFADRVSIEWDVEPQTLSVAVPALLLQPLLENAFKHGVERSQEPVTIRIGARRVGDQLQFSVHNQGELGPQREAGIGLRNGRERLRLLYGSSASLQLQQELSGVAARVTLPWQQCT